MLDKHDFDSIFENGTLFGDVYRFVSNREINKTMKKWTIAIGIMTFIMLLCTIVNLISTLQILAKSYIIL